MPFSQAGLAATRALSSEGIRINMTLVFSANQALLSAEAGATYISCFMGRLDDISVDSTAVLREIVETLRPGGYTAQVLAASIRHPEHVVTAAKLGCEVATVPAKVLRQMLDHPLTTAGIEKFTADWQSRPEFAEWLKGLTERREAERAGRVGFPPPSPRHRRHSPCPSWTARSSSRATLPIYMPSRRSSESRATAAWAATP